MAPVFALPPLAGALRTGAATGAWSQGRLEQRQRHTRAVRGGDSDGPGWAQVCQLARHVLSKKPGTVRAEGGVGVPRLAWERAAARQLLALGRAPWPSENRAHGVRDVTVDADRSQGRGGNIPQVMAACRTTVMGLWRGAGSTNIAAACRRCAALPAFALALIGMTLEN
jgi:hypothetical protein